MPIHSDPSSRVRGLQGLVPQDGEVRWALRVVDEQCVLLTFWCQARVPPREVLHFGPLEFTEKRFWTKKSVSFHPDDTALQTCWMSHAGKFRDLVLSDKEVAHTWVLICYETPGCGRNSDLNRLGFRLGSDAYKIGDRPVKPVLVASLARVLNLSKTASYGIIAGSVGGAYAHDFLMLVRPKIFAPVTDVFYFHPCWSGSFNNDLGSLVRLYASSRLRQVADFHLKAIPAWAHDRGIWHPRFQPQRAIYAVLKPDPLSAGSITVRRTPSCPESGSAPCQRVVCAPGIMNMLSQFGIKAGEDMCIRFWLGSKDDSVIGAGPISTFLDDYVKQFKHQSPDMAPDEVLSVYVQHGKGHSGGWSPEAYRALREGMRLEPPRTVV
jgi:hypothetical protein